MTMSIVSHPPSATLPPDLESNRRIYDEYFDIEFAVQLSKHVLEILEQYYFRTRLINFELPIERNNPDRPLVFAGNHSGMAFPWDGIIFASLYLKMNNYQLKNATRPLSAPLLSRSTLMNPFLIPDLWKRVGCIDATFPNFETMMYYPNSNLFIYPEGVPGIGKGYNRRYRLQRLSSSFIYMSIKYKTDIVPVYTVNGEYINPQSYSIPWLNRLTEKIGIPFIPIGLLLPFCSFSRGCFIILFLPNSPLFAANVSKYMK
ncbi:MAG: hypothetical protein IPL35_01190 [Sphingobacteriales bacterium]|nr:hypothetical protein [Sphingobacteriales bacterium]